MSPFAEFSRQELELSSGFFAKTRPLPQTMPAPMTNSAFNFRVTPFIFSLSVVDEDFYFFVAPLRPRDDDRSGK
jgi:hypothetical protein